MVLKGNEILARRVMTERGPGRWALREYFTKAVALWIKGGPGNTFSGLDYSMLSKSIQAL